MPPDPSIAHTGADDTSRHLCSPFIRFWLQCHCTRTGTSITVCWNSASLSTFMNLLRTLGSLSLPFLSLDMFSVSGASGFWDEMYTETAYTGQFDVTVHNLQTVSYPGGRAAFKLHLYLHDSDTLLTGEYRCDKTIILLYHHPDSTVRTCR